MNRLLVAAVALVVLSPDARGQALSSVHGGSSAPTSLDTTPQSLPFTQAWTNTALIAVTNDWSGVPGIVAYRGDDLTIATGTDPQTLLADGSATLVNVIANQTNPNTVTAGGVAEFEVTQQAPPAATNATVAMQGSGTADAPHLVLNVDATGMMNIVVSYNLRDIDCAVDNAIQPVAMHYRVGAAGSYVNLPAGYVADAATGPSLCTLVTPVSVTLPPDVNGQAVVHVRVMTTNAVGSDEWVGVDDISVTGVPVSQNLVGGAGWRMLSAPLDGMDVSYLVGQNLVQGLPDEFPGATPNVHTVYNGQGTVAGWLAPAGEATPLEPGKGFIWYLYNQTFDPDPANAAGQSESFALPRALAAVGEAVNATGGLYSPAAFPLRAPGGDDMFLMGNPFAAAFDISGLTVSAGTLQNSVLVYDPAIANYRVVSANPADTPDANDVTDDIAVWQGLFAQVTGFDVTTTALTPTFNRAFATAAAPPFYGFGPGPGVVGREVRFELVGELASGAATTDLATILQFAEGAGEGWDRYDLRKVGPPSSAFALLGLRSTGPDGSNAVQSVASRERDPSAPFTIPLALATSEAGEFTLTWLGITTLPGDWSLSLRDLVTGDVLDLADRDFYTFTAGAGAWVDRFALDVSVAVVAGEPGVDGFLLTPAAPNPTDGLARLTLRVSAPQHVRADVFDALGRRVATLIDAVVGAGESRVLVFDAGALAPGAYVVRVTGETFSETRRVTVVR